KEQDSMGYSPRHARPVSLTLKSHHRPPRAGEPGAGRHRVDNHADLGDPAASGDRAVRVGATQATSPNDDDRDSSGDSAGDGESDASRGAPRDPAADLLAELIPAPRSPHAGS